MEIICANCKKWQAFPPTGKEKTLLSELSKQTSKNTVLSDLFLLKETRALEILSPGQRSCSLGDLCPGFNDCAITSEFSPRFTDQVVNEKSADYFLPLGYLIRKQIQNK
jgi:hypothetical protein